MSLVLLRAKTYEVLEEKCRQIYRAHDGESFLGTSVNGERSSLICLNSTISDTCQGEFLKNNFLAF